MRQEEKHLSAEQVDCVVEEQLGAQDSQARSDLLEQAHRHLAVCETCQRRVSMHREIDRILRNIGETSPSEVSGDCPSEQSLHELAAGVSDAGEAERVSQHSATCDHCGPLLRQAIEVFEKAETEEEERMFASLKTSQPEWQRRLAVTLAKRSAVSTHELSVSSARASSKGFRLRLASRWAYTMAATVVLAIGMFGWLKWHSSPSYAGRLLAQAYSQQRTLELRIPGARYAPFHIQRGTDHSRFDRPASLLEAEEVIGKKLDRDPKDPAWLQAKARAELLDGNYESAIQSLQRALETEPESSSLLTDLATAYYERAQVLHRDIDYGTAVEYLGRALAKSPDDPVALFNRAIASEKIFLYAQAESDWELYIRVDPQGAWSNDARQRLANLREKLKKHEQGMSVPLLAPQQLVKADLQDVGLRAAVDERIEDYLHLAIGEWLPQAFPEDSRAVSKDFGARRSLRFLAELTAEQHGDLWLGDFLAGSSAPTFSSGVQALALAIKANEAGDYVKAKSSAARAEQLFASGSNTAGVLRARLENIYALHLSHEGISCLSAVSASADEIAEHPFPWMHIRFHLEESSCLALMSNLGNALRVVDAALKEAQEHRYGASSLRALGFASDDFSQTGNLNEAWNRAHEGLEKFWSGTYPNMPGYNLYTDLDTAAESARQAYLQVAIWRQALAMIASDEDPLLGAMAHSWAGSAAFSANMDGAAEAEFAEASRLFALAPQSESTRNNHIEAEAWVGRLQARRGQGDIALARLRRLRPDVERLSDNYVAISFYTTLGEVELRQNATEDAGAALHTAVSLGELTLRSMKSEGDRLAWSRETSSAYRALVEWQLAQGNVEGALETWEWYRGGAVRLEGRNVQGTESSAGESSPGGLSELRNLPALHGVTDRLAKLKSATVLSYVVLPEKIIVWTYDNRGVSAQRIQGLPTDIERRARRFSELCSDPRSDLQDVKENARELYDLLVAPIKEKLVANRTLIIETDGSLAGIPMEALLDPEWHYLGETFTIVSSLGLYYDARLRSSEHLTASAQALVVSVPAPDVAVAGMLSPLNDSINEASTVSKDFVARRLLEGSQATLSTVQRELPGTEIFHFSGHSTSSAERVGLVLSDALLVPSALEQAQLKRMQLAVLSACATDRGVEGKYQDPDSFARAFQRAGVPHVVASRWNVDSSATATFMKDFYQALLGGRTVSESLRQAATASRSRSETIHPYYWSAFRVFGSV